MRAVRLGIATAVSAAVALVVSGAASETHRVGPSERLRTITAALDAAAPGDAILVLAGTYRENIRITVPVHLQGEGGARIVGKRDGDVVQILAGDVHLSGFEISGSGGDMVTSDAGIMISGPRARVTGNRLVDNHYGIYLRQGSDALLQDNRITGRPEIDVGERGAAIHLYDAHRNQIRGNRVTLVRDGVYFDHSDDNLVEDNEFSQLRYGVHYMFCNQNAFYRNVFRDSMAGVAIMNTDRVTFSDNLIVHNRLGHNAFGLLLKDCTHSVAERNVIADNVNGIFLEGAHENRFVHNLVAYNDVGVLLFSSALDNAFEANDFVGNLATLHTVGRAHAQWAPGDRGNYYSDYMGYDIDLDGVGDVPHRLQDAFEHLEGNHPLLRLFLSSAAADALAAAEKSFPVIPGGDERDPAPRLRPCSGVFRTLSPARPPDSRWLGAATSLLASLAVMAFCWRLRA